MPKTSITAGAIRDAMSARWAEPEWAIMWEVSEATGMVRGRSADAVMMSLWPSRGLELHGVEIKVSRSDWKREAASPLKAESIAKYCDRWWVHTSPGVVDDLSDVPPAWGLREWDGKRWLTRREAEKTEAEPVSRGFLASMLRRADDTMRSMMESARQAAEVAAREEIEQRRADIQAQIERGVQARTKDMAMAEQNFAEFELVFGKHPKDIWRGQAAQWGAAARALADCGRNGYGHLADRLRSAAEEIDAIEKIIKPVAEE